MLKVAVFTGTRAEYGLLYWLLKALQADASFELQLIVSGTHLSPLFGETWKEIHADGFEIAAKVEMLLSSDSAVATVKSMGLGLLGFADTLKRLAPDILVVLGDRYEALAITQTALILNIPIAHIHGGEQSLGAYDEAIRHAISKMAFLHFVAAEPYRRRLIQMGERPEQVFNVGALGLEHLLKKKPETLTAFMSAFQIELKNPYFFITYHPVTLAEEPALATVEALFKVLEDYPFQDLIFTYPNADNGGQVIIEALKQFCAKRKGAFLFPSLGVHWYLTAVAHADVVVGNSSSGIIEVPSLGIPTVNIGQRQKGRLAASSIIHAKACEASIREALHLACSPSFKLSCQKTVNPYGQGNAAAAICDVLKQRKFSTIKHFYDLEFNDEILPA